MLSTSKSSLYSPYPPSMAQYTYISTDNFCFAKFKVSTGKIQARHVNVNVPYMQNKLNLCVRVFLLWFQSILTLFSKSSGE